MSSTELKMSSKHLVDFFVFVKNNYCSLSSLHFPIFTKLHNIANIWVVFLQTHTGPLWDNWVNIRLHFVTTYGILPSKTHFVLHVFIFDFLHVIETL